MPGGAGEHDGWLPTPSHLPSGGFRLPGIAAKNAEEFQCRME